MRIVWFCTTCLKRPRRAGRDDSHEYSNDVSHAKAQSLREAAQIGFFIFASLFFIFASLRETGFVCCFVVLSTRHQGTDDAGNTAAAGPTALGSIPKTCRTNSSKRTARDRDRASRVAAYFGAIADQEWR